MLDPLARTRRLAPLALAAIALTSLVAPIAVATGAAPAPGAWVSPALVALAVGLTTHVVAAARAGWSGVIGGAVAGGWLAACPPARAAGAVLGAEAIALVATAGLLTASERLVRAGDHPVDRGLVAALLAVVVVIADLRAWPLALVAAALITRRADPRARWLSLAPWLGGLTAALLVLLGALGHGPSWAAPPASAGAAAWLADAVDRLGPIAIIAGALGVIALARARADRWLGALAVGALATLVPLALPLATPALAAWTLGLGLAVAAVADQVARPVHQALAGATLAVLLAAPFALT